MTAEQEHLDYMNGCANEQQNALVMSRMNMKPDDKGKIDKLLKAGRYVVYESHVAFCPSTDAIIGSLDFYQSDWASYQEASKALKLLIDKGEASPEDLCIWPPRERRPLPFSSSDDEALPF